MKMCFKKMIITGLLVISLPVLADTAKVVRIGYNASGIPGLVKDSGWLEEELKAQGVRVEWVQAFGSNKTFEYFRGNSIDFGWTAASASLIARANGLPVKIALVTNQGKDFLNALVAIDPKIKSVADLRGRKVAVTLATETHWFLLAALDEAGINRKEVTIVPLPPAEGRLALETGAVSAYSGFDPEVARIQVSHNARVVYRNPKFESFSVINVSDRFAKENPEITQRVIDAHNRGRQMLETNPELAIERLVTFAKLNQQQAKLVQSRTDISLVPLDSTIEKRLSAFGPILKELKLIDANVDVATFAKEVLAPQYVEAINDKKR